MCNRGEGEGMNSINLERLFTVNKIRSTEICSTRSSTIRSLKREASKIEIDSSRHAIILEKKIIDPDSG